MTLLEAARQALPGLPWELCEDGEVYAKTLAGQVNVWITGDNTILAQVSGTNPIEYDTCDDFRQHFRANIAARRDSEDAALGEPKRLGLGAVEWAGMHRIAAARADAAEAKLKALAGLVEKWEIAGHGKTRKVVTGKLYINGLPPCPAFFGGGEPCECGADAANAARAEARRLCGVDNG